MYIFLNQTRKLSLIATIFLLSQLSAASNFSIILRDNEPEKKPEEHIENQPEKTESKDDINDINILFSDEITLFENDLIPTNKDLFDAHVAQLEFEIPMQYNQYVKDQIDFFGVRWQHKLKKMIREAEYYFPIYERIFDKNDMPLELAYLSIIESALNPAATSRAGAAGLWQFMPATGRLYKLEQNYYVDERRDIEKSTEAACAYLRRMHNHYGDWLLSIASYNCGPGNVNKAMRKSGGETFWEIIDFLPRETQKYVPKFIAMAYLMNFHSEFNIVPALTSSDKEVCIPVVCEKTLDISIVCKKLDIEEDELKQYNPGLRASVIPSKADPLRLYIPASKLQEFYSQLDEIIEESANTKAVNYSNRNTVHIVKRGECLPVIARKHGVTVTNIKQWNNLRSNTIHPNQRLKIH